MAMDRIQHSSPPRVTHQRYFSVLLLFIVTLATVPAAASAFSVPPSPMTVDSCSATTTLGPSVLRGLVQNAASEKQSQSLDLNGIAWLEHLNLVVGDMAIAKKFYVDFLGLSRDDNPKHFNLGQQQFHLAANDEEPQRVTGSIGLTVPSLIRIRERIGNARSELAGTQFSIVKDDHDNYMTVTCPWGNTFHLYDISIDADHPSADGSSQSSQKMVKLHGDGGTYGPHRMAVRGSPGIRYVEIACRMETVDSIAKFYENVLGCHVTRSKMTTNSGSDAEVGVEAAAVCVGPGVHMVFVENRQLSDNIIEQMEGVHACIYIPNFQQTYNALNDRKLIWTNPRFTHLDSCDSWEEAYASRTFRFKNVTDISTGEKLLEFEHETRPMMHGQFLKVPSYTPN
ncbi:hypothetical protein ACHAXR_007765 [Thalassiosira sp. AJA248-18]